MRELYEDHRPTPSQILSSNRIVLDLEDIIQHEFKKSYQVRQFGSAITGLGGKESDLDLIVLVTGDGASHGEAHELQLKKSKFKIFNILNLVKILKRHYARVRTVPASAVPIAKCIDRETGTPLDICINERLGLRNSVLLARYLDTHDDLRPLAFAIKLWAKSHDLVGADRNRFSSFALVVMLIGLLQSRGFLPNLQKGFDRPVWLRRNDHTNKHLIYGTHQRVIRPCDTRYHEVMPGWKPSTPFDAKEALLDFFKYFHTANHTTSMIMMRRGGLFRRMSSAEHELLQESKVRLIMEEERQRWITRGEDVMDIDKRAMRAGLNGPERRMLMDIIDLRKGFEGPEDLYVKSNQWAGAHLVVGDPFIHSKNLTQNVSKLCFDRFVTRCEEAVGILEGGGSLEEIFGSRPVENVDS